MRTFSRSSMPKYTVKIADTDDELKNYFLIRHDVFVKDQKLFTKSDRDEYDEDAIHIIAIEKSSGRVVGVVRCYKKEGDTWYGGRLGAAPDYRNGRVGPHLVRFAVSIAKTRGCKKFLAYVQLHNVKFFRRLDWSTVEEPIVYQRIPHQLMEANLDSY
jgi:putative N-acetyltransferase (TIGR04045 family)